MSSYIEMHVLRLPFSKSDLQGKEWDSVENMINDKGLLYDVRQPENRGFEVQCTDAEFCLDYVLKREGFADDGDYGYARELTEEEKQEAKPLFDALGIQYNINDIHYVHYCWYNCSEPPYYYEVVTPQNVFRDL